MDLGQAVGASDVTRALPGAAKTVTQGLSPTELPDLSLGVDNLLREASRQAGSLFRDSLGSMLLILGIAALCRVVAVLLSDSDKQIRPATLAGVLGIAAVTGTQTHSLLRLGRDTITQLDQFSKVLLPSFAAISATAGAPTAAFARQMATVLFSDVLITLADRVLIPMVYAYFALVTCNALLGQDMLARLAKLVKWAMTGLLTLLLTAYGLYLSLTSVISGTTDAVALKTAKLALSGAVPVVGGVLSDAAETVLAGAGLIRNALGLFGVFALLGICLAPFLRLGIQTLLYKVAAALCAPLADGPVAKYLDEVGTVFTLILALVATCSFVLMIALVSGVQLTS